MPSYAYPPAPPLLDPTPLAELDRAVARLSAQKAAWPKVSVHERVLLLDQMIDGIRRLGPSLVARGNQVKGFADDDPRSGEEWLATPPVILRNLRLLRRTLVHMRDHGAPPLDEAILSERPNGQVVARVFPGSVWDRLVFGGVQGEVWMQPGVTREGVRDQMGSRLRSPPDGGRVALVLGAGNQTSIPATDAVYKLFVENEVVLLKMNPVNEFVGPVLSEAWEPLVNMGVFEVVYGGAEAGAHLCNHPLVDTIHITGSDATHDAIVWGPREGRAERKASGEPVNARPITSELGNVTPIVVVPGDWSPAELAWQALNVASMVENNASFNCVAGKLLVTARDWPLRDAFLAAVRAAIRALPARKAWYPGARDRWQAFVDAHPDKVEVLGADAPDTVPWTLISGLDPGAGDEICFRQEPFCGLLNEVPLPGATPMDFLPGAVDFCNERVWGTLGCALLIHPSTRRDPGSEAAFQEALDDLRYGSIGVNVFPGVVFGLSELTWGAFPGHALDDIQSGRGVVHNSFLFDRPQKSVLYAPFTQFPKPPWFSGHRRMHRLGEALTGFEAQPSLLGLLPLGWAALRP